MVEQHQRALKTQLWNIANTLRGNMSADDFRDYILGLIFYKYLSDKLNRYCDELLIEDGIQFVDADDELIGELREECVENLGYFIAPTQLFSTLAKRGEKKEFILHDLERVLVDIEHSQPLRIRRMTLMACSKILTLTQASWVKTQTLATPKWHKC